ncbi:MAG: hypothetical protein ABR956_12230 [Terracidiphilus sp.]|jgi:hypothetical protein
MRTIAELSVLLRAKAELPAGLKLATDEFHEGWSFMRTGNVVRLKRKIQTQGWNFIRTGDGSLRSGVGDTSQQAIASALKLALRRVNTFFNAAEVEHIELTQYPWFYLARVRVYPYRIQQGAMMAATDDPVTVEMAQQEAGPFPHFGSAMPVLKEMLISNHNWEASAS